MRVCAPIGVCVLLCVHDGLEKEDKWSVATEASDFIHQTAQPCALQVRLEDRGWKSEN